MPALGVRLRDNQLTYPAMRDLVRLAEQRGYDSVWLPESSGREIFTELTALAQTSARVRLGTGIVPVFTRLPTVASAAMATAATVAPGRVILGGGLGIAAGWKQATVCISTSLCSTSASLSRLPVSS
jgi:alkanesulfonate monooxygenase SsuD/methylene tetrahydromethanopterin reductase-like flavin-dependent oxidoreductase (luciferase family)